MRARVAPVRSKKTTKAVGSRGSAVSLFDISKHTKAYIKSSVARGKVSNKSGGVLTLQRRRQLIQAADKLAALKAGRSYVSRSIKPSVDKTHPFKNKRGPLMTKRNKRLSFFFRAVRSLSSQLFSGYRAKELKARRRRRHFKFFASVNQAGLSSDWHRRAFYSIKNERVR